jgi:predicted RNase H-like nuclease (RuvC/YqgF family)
VTTLALGQDDGYGYTPGIGATVIEGVKIEKPAPPVKPPEKEPEKEIEKIKAETERLEASRRRIEELNKAVEKLDSQLERDLITKNEYKKYLKKLYGM